MNIISSIQNLKSSRKGQKFFQPKNILKNEFFSKQNIKILFLNSLFTNNWEERRCVKMMVQLQVDFRGRISKWVHSSIYSCVEKFQNLYGFTVLTFCSILQFIIQMKKGASLCNFHEILRSREWKKSFTPKQYWIYVGRVQWD